MLLSSAALGILSLALFFVARAQEGDRHLQGVRLAVQMMLPAIPLRLFAFLSLGLLQAILPRETLLGWIGAQSGWRGILVGTVAGGLSPGGPVVQALFGAALWRSGAGIGVLIAYLTGGALWGLTRLPIDVGILGWRVVLVRLACTFFIPPIAGWLAQALFGGMR